MQQARDDKMALSLRCRGSEAAHERPTPGGFFYDWQAMALQVWFTRQRADAGLAAVPMRARTDQHE